MKKYFILVASILLMSCNSTSYVFDTPTQTNGVDFSQGNWLLNEVNVPYYLTEKITAKAVEDFSANLGSRLRYAPDTKGLLLPQKEIQINPSKSVLSNLYIGTKYDYFINIKASENKNQFGSLDLTNHHLKTGNNVRESEVIIEIYDLKNTTIIYSQKVIASVTQMKNSSDVAISKSQYSMILGAYNRIIKDINSKSVR